MTYCVGWKYKQCVYLLADSAATKSDVPNSRYSSFGELHDEVDGQHVEESLLKLVPIGPGTVIAFAGDERFARQIINCLKDNISGAASSNTELISKMAISMGPFDAKRKVALLLASSKPDGAIELLKWDTEAGLDAGASDWYQIGSLASYHAALTPSLLSSFVSGNLAVDRFLPCMTAVVQSYGVHDNLINMNVGGLIFGVRTEHGRISWQEDTNFVLYDRAVQQITYISALARDDVVVVRSSVTNDTRLFAHSTSTPSLIKWIDTWGSRVHAQLDSNAFRFWVFISTAEKVITIIVRHDVAQDSRFVRLTAMGDDKGIAFSSELMSLLLQPLQDRDGYNLPFRLNVRNDEGSALQPIKTNGIKPRAAACLRNR